VWFLGAIHFLDIYQQPHTCISQYPPCFVLFQRVELLFVLHQKMKNAIILLVSTVVAAIILHAKFQGNALLGIESFAQRTLQSLLTQGDDGRTLGSPAADLYKGDYPNQFVSASSKGKEDVGGKEDIMRTLKKKKTAAPTTGYGGKAGFIPTTPPTKSGKKGPLV